MSKPRILFFGYSEVGYQCLELLLSRGDKVVAVISHEDNPNEKIWFKTPAVAAREHGVPLYTPENVNTPEWQERIAALKPDLILSVYYRNMISTRILALPPLGAFNMHGSLLPRYRGRAPINWAVLQGEPRIGMSLHRMVKAPDAGALVDQEGVEIGPRDTAEQAFRKVMPCARAVLERQIDALLSGTAHETEQDSSLATYFGGRKPEDGRIDWAKTPVEIFNLIRAVTDPYPGAFSDVNGARLMVWWAEPQSEAARAAQGKASRSGKGEDSSTGADAEPCSCLGAGEALEAEAASLAPGQVLSLEPLVVSAQGGALELTRIEWRGTPVRALQLGDRLGA